LAGRPIKGVRLFIGSFRVHGCDCKPSDKTRDISTKERSEKRGDNSVRRPSCKG
jgi:hypothetical protein